jgi:hypothetical protein
MDARSCGKGTLPIKFAATHTHFSLQDLEAPPSKGLQDFRSVELSTFIIR